MDQLELINFVFQYDNDPKQTSKFVNDYLKENNIELLPQPSQSPDLNPIEHLWSYVKCEYEKTPVTSKKELRKRISNVWSSIPTEMTERLLKSMKNRLIEAKGGSTSY